jgi:H+/gluconate symporter-like permease
VLGVLAAEALIALLLRLAVGAPPAAATVTASALAPLEVPAAPALIAACDELRRPTSTLRVCARL